MIYPSQSAQRLLLNSGSSTKPGTENNQKKRKILVHVQSREGFRGKKLSRGLLGLHKCQNGASKEICALID